MEWISSVRAGTPAGDHLEPPTWQLPGLVAAERVVTRSNDVVISAGPLRVFTTGCLVTFYVRFRVGGRSPSSDMDELYRLIKGQRFLHDGQLTLAVRYTMSSSHSKLEEIVADRTWTDDLSSHLISIAGGSHGGGRVWYLTYWLRPVPVGDVNLLAVWPARGVPRGGALYSKSEVRKAFATIYDLG